MRLLITYMLSVSFAVSAIGQTFKAKCGVSSIPAGQQFKVIYTVDAPGGGFKGPDLKDFNVAMGPNFSQSVQISGNRMQASYSYSYVLSGKKPGTYTIGSASVTANGKRITSNTLTIKITQGGKAVSSQNGQNSSGNNEISQYLFIKGAASKKKVYLGEQLTATYKLYNSVRFVDSGIEKMPSLNGFWSQDVKSPFDHVTWNTEYVNKRQFEVAELKKTVLFPQRTGTLEVDPLAMTFEVQQMSRNFFDNFFGRAKSKRYKIESKPTKITVLPLPTKGQPESFAGAVGDFKISSNVDRAEVSANDAITLKVKIEGTGNLQLLEPLELNLPADFEVYDPKINDDISVLASGVRGIREFEYLIIPRHAGSFKIDAVEFSYFDPSRKKYYTRTAKEIPLRVEKSTTANGSAISSRSMSREEVEMLNQDIRHIYDVSYNTVSEKQTFFGSKGFWLLTGFPFLLLFVAIAYRRKYKERKADVVGKKERKAGRVASKYLKQARASLNANDHSAVFEHVAAAMNGFIADKLRIDTSQFSQERIEEILSERGVERSTIDALHNVMEDCDMARFSAASVGASAATLDGAERVIEQINRQA